MTGADWIGLVTAIGVLFGSLGKGFAWLMDRMSAQSKTTIDELRKDRDYWRNRALGENPNGQEGSS